MAWAAARMASRAWMKFGLSGESFMPSVTICRARWLPVAKPRRVMSRARTSSRAMHQTSPALWTSVAVFEIQGAIG